MNPSRTTTVWSTKTPSWSIGTTLTPTNTTTPGTGSTVTEARNGRRQGASTNPDRYAHTTVTTRANASTPATRLIARHRTGRPHRTRRSSRASAAKKIVSELL
jgi:hypothetical protein